MFVNIQQIYVEIAYEICSFTIKLNKCQYFVSDIIKCVYVRVSGGLYTSPIIAFLDNPI